MSGVRSAKILVFSVVISATLALWLGGGAGGFTSVTSALSGWNIEGWVASAGMFGPLIIIGLMAVAVVASPIPSAPIALAAGAAYGHIYGTVYVVAGAQTGALVAFGLARWLGRDVLLKWFGARIETGMFGSQNALTVMVLLSRLMPFVSFDLVSYAAGLSPLQTWRFALATLTGIIPASFLLAHFGGEISSADMGGMIWAVLGLGLITGLPLIIAARRGKTTNNSQKEQGTL